MNQSFKFNPSALLLSEPNSVFLVSSVGKNCALFARRSSQSGLFKPVVHASNPLLNNPQYRHLTDGAAFRDILDAAQAESLEFCPSFHTGEHLEFMQTQLEARCGAGSVLPRRAQLALDAFLNSASRLAVDLQPVLPGFTAGVKHSLPKCCFAVSKRQEGLFVWPNWRKAGEVFAVVSLPDKETQVAGDVLQSWLARERFTLAPATGFN